MPSAGARTLANDFPPAVTVVEATAGTTTSTSYTSTLTGGTACGTTFTAPTSERVLVHNVTRISNSAAVGTFCGWVIRTGSTIGSGSVVTSADDSRALVNAATTAVQFGATYLVTSGLTAGSVYNIQQVFKVASDTGTYTNKIITVVPAS